VQETEYGTAVYSSGACVTNIESDLHSTVLAAFQCIKILLCELQTPDTRWGKRWILHKGRLLSSSTLDEREVNIHILVICITTPCILVGEDQRFG